MPAAVPHSRPAVPGDFTLTTLGGHETGDARNAGSVLVSKLNLVEAREAHAEVCRRTAAESVTLDFESPAMRGIAGAITGGGSGPLATPAVAGRGQAQPGSARRKR